jgi:protein-S-isoprenylcysteine O-methyltransferase Ste14
MVLWFAWYVTWVAAVAWSARTKVQMKTDMAGLSRLCFSVGLVLLLFVPAHMGTVAFGTDFADSMTGRLWQESAQVAWSLFAVVVACFGFCWWARVHLGRLWSGFVTLKEGHHIVDTGPYGLVRHPIYSGIIAAALATALMKATPAALAGFALTAAGLSMIAKIEERFLREQLGTEAYDGYRRRVGMLIPGF